MDAFLQIEQPHIERCFTCERCGQIKVFSSLHAADFPKHWKMVWNDDKYQLVCDVCLADEEARHPEWGLSRNALAAVLARTE